MTLSKERLVAFTDAVLAIIMTILVLELERPEELTWQGLWDLRMNFFAYTISFFWLGTMWVNLHRSWDSVEKINNNLVWNSLILLFFSSFFPYATNLVASDFNNSVAQVFYGMIILAVTGSNVWMYRELSKLSEEALASNGFNILDRAGKIDVIIKIIGLLLSLTVFPPAVMWSVLITAVVIVIPRSV